MDGQQYGGVALGLLNGMPNSTDLFGESTFRISSPSFWERVCNDEQLDGCSALEKLIAGCELIAALDSVDLLVPAAAKPGKKSWRYAA
jgi:hypothetical protein